MTTEVTQPGGKKKRVDTFDIFRRDRLVIKTPVSNSPNLRETLTIKDGYWFTYITKQLETKHLIGWEKIGEPTYHTLASPNAPGYIKQRKHPSSIVLSGVPIENITKN